MESDYDRKFGEMKKYIPFLERMIKRLETTNTSSSSNPRQAQLDKIRSLRDLLLDRKNRMKMENLLKCEQVLVNLYAKVEPGDTLPGIKKAETIKSDFNSVGKKLQSVAIKIKDEDPDTLPEIARANEVEVVCTPGSKEPALFQRRPNKASISPSRKAPPESSKKKSPRKAGPKRNYTRVLVSPEPSTRASKRWSTTSEVPPSDKSLFSRRSPRRSPKRHSPSYTKEIKKSSKQCTSTPEDLNITLNVPEESLSSLNTGDILSRIIKCPDNDVDIDTLRDLRSQILGELKLTGASEDISDLILKSYKTKKKRNKKNEEVEEGELSDSESEAIQSIYGSLVVVDKDNKNMAKNPKTSLGEDKQSRKIQICLVINSDKDGNTTEQDKGGSNVTEETDFHMFDDNEKLNEGVVTIQTKQKPTSKSTVVKSLGKELAKKVNITSVQNKSEDVFTIDVDEDDDLKKVNTIDNDDSKDSDTSYIDVSSSDNDVSPKSSNKAAMNTESNEPFQANFYKPMKEHNEIRITDFALKSSEDVSELKKSDQDKNQKNGNKTEQLQENTESLDEPVKNASIQNQPSTTDKNILIEKKSSAPDQENNVEDIEKISEIPLLNTEPVVPEPSKKKDAVSELDILQALKNEILSETISVPGAEVATPPLHLPKITKVASAQEIMTKKRISIEKYKEKSVSTPKSSLFLNNPKIPKSKDSCKKTSLKLTEQEQQRFNFLPLALEDSSDDEDSFNYSVDDIYGDLAPKSPENSDKTLNSESSAPIIIPVEPVKSTTVSSNTDVDMRTFPILSPNAAQQPSLLPSMKTNNTGNEKQLDPKRALLDPRVRRDYNKPFNKDSPNPHGTPRNSGNFPSMTPNMTPRSFDMTPSHPSFDDGSSRKHVYAPFPAFETREHKEPLANKEPRWEQNSDKSVHEPRWELNSEPPGDDQNSRWDPWKDSDVRDRNQSRKWEDRDYRGRSVQENISDYHKSRYDSDKYHKAPKNDRYSQEQRDDYSFSRMDCPRTPIHQFDCPTTPTPSFGRVDVPVNSFGRSDCPTTPIHSFGRSDCPTTPIHSFGRADCPTTPSHPFGRNDCPTTPIHPFGRNDCPTTPSHPFGRNDCPTTPSHPFGRNDCPSTPSHCFGRLDCPTTPSHPFGRTDCPATPVHPFGQSNSPMTPSHPFGRPDVGMTPITPSHTFVRSDYPINHQSSGLKVVKDPRLNRSTDYDSNSRRCDENRDRNYYKERRSDLNQNKSYNNSESYRNYREQSVGKNDRIQRQGRERTPGRATSVSRDFDSGRMYSRERENGRSSRYRPEFENSKSYIEVGSRRDQSLGRSGPSSERFQRASSRPLNDNNHCESSNDNTLSVKSKSGRTFTIDTSVNTTFQEFLSGKGLQVFDYSFDDRRRRAVSVGRTLTRESSVGRNFREGSVGRTLLRPSQPSRDDTSDYRRMVNFVRAKSMGRELVDRKEKSLKEIKADFESYRESYKEKERININDKTKNHDHCSRKDLFDKYSDKKYNPHSKNTNYSPRKNYRDPRMNQIKYEDKRKPYGIVYSSDNLARGTILGSGYGVKNYKIPKIKRPVEDKETSVVDLNKDKQDTNKTLDTKPKEMKLKSKEILRQDKSKAISKEDKNKEIPSKTKCGTKKVKGSKATGEKDKKKLNETSGTATEILNKNSRASKLSDLSQSDEEPIFKTRKVKRGIIDSDSDSETLIKNVEQSRASEIDTKTTLKDQNKLKDQQKPMESNENCLLDNSFGIDDLDLFPDNITSNSVLSNINALIADLDNEIGISKEDTFTKDGGFSAFDQMLETINSPEAPEHGLNNEISKLVKTSTNIEKKNETLVKNTDKDANKSVEESPSNFEKSANNEDSTSDEKDACKSNVPLNVKVDAQVTTEIKVSDVENCLQNNKTRNSETRVTTTEFDTEPAKKIEEFGKDISKKSEEINEDRSSTPDSTNNTNEITQNKSHDDSLPDSTNEKNEMQSHVSSSHNQTDAPEITPNPSQKDTADSIGNLLSILQDKTKIKELLSMLGDQSGDNEKIKKKLEKLSEIVSDDDDNIDDVNNDTTGQITEEIQVNESNETAGFTSKPEVIASVGLNKKDEILIDKTDSKNLAEIPEVIPSVGLDKTEEIFIDKVDNVSTLKANFDNNLETEKPDEKYTNELENKNQERTSVSAKTKKPRKVPIKKTKKGKRKTVKKEKPGKRVTRSEAANLRSAKPKKACRELKQLQESIKEMFIKDDILNATGIRMCRLAKLVDEKKSNQTEDNDLQTAEPKPVVVLEKFKESELRKNDKKEVVKIKKKPGPKPKSQVTGSCDKLVDTSKFVKKYKPGPKSKTKVAPEDSDTYSFDDSVSEATTQISEQENESDSETESLASSKSFGSSEVSSELKKKPKRKRRYGWQSGFIKKRKRVLPKHTECTIEDNILMLQKAVQIPDMDCFTDKTYCFLKNVSIYPCRLCDHRGSEIVKHYKTDHPHTEIPLSRMNGIVAQEAIQQCEDIHFQVLSKVHSDRYMCRFCFLEFSGKKNILEEFFWHVVSMHTGEYKQLCSECVTATSCPFNLDIPPPPKDIKGQLMGYICGKCNFTQVSLENLKTHVIVRHNDEMTAVYTINLAMISKKTLKALMKQCPVTNKTRVLRSSRSNPSEVSDPSARSDITESTDGMSISDVDSLENKHIPKNEVPKVMFNSKITFENDDNSDAENTEVKPEKEDNESENIPPEEPHFSDLNKNTLTDGKQPSSDILDCPHFKICYKDTGTKEYVCCINGEDNHYKTTLLISMKKHIQTKHSEVWDGYCFICKVIVMPQGEHNFKECFQHMLDKHLDSFPVFKEISLDNEQETVSPDGTPTSNTNEHLDAVTDESMVVDRPTSPKSYINVRRLSDLINNDATTEESTKTLPIIESVVSLGSNINETPEISPVDTPEIASETTSGTTSIFRSSSVVFKPAPKPEEPYKYEEKQKEVMSKKHLVILDAMMSEEKLVQIYKCAGRYCSFTTDSADAAVLHASTHERVGGENGLDCAYCDFDCKGNAIDLVMHVFKTHGRCQFVCGSCFYRAVASELVFAHIRRVHGASPKGIVLETATVSPIADDAAEVLPREVAVQHYMCFNSDATCKYKTYTQGKFMEHMLLKHKAPFKCFKCLLATDHPTELIQHLIIHGLHLYQCTWCLDGGDNEADFMAHSSVRHPTRQPQAYLRIITNNQKDGSSKTMVLPLVKLNKWGVPTKLIAPSAKPEHPVREAERALDLEKIITSMSLFSDVNKEAIQSGSVATITNHPLEQPIFEELPSPLTSMAEVIPIEPPRVVTPPPSTSLEEQKKSLQLTPVLKQEPIDDAPPKAPAVSEVICLDSDEEEDTSDVPSKQNIIDIPDDDPKEPNKIIDIPDDDPKEPNKKIDLLQLFKCKNCLNVFNKSGFKRHIISCFASLGDYGCAHCSFSTSDRELMFIHYTCDHGPFKRQNTVFRYTCGICSHTEKHLSIIKSHTKKEHGFTNLNVTLTSSESDQTNFIVNKATKTKQLPKRKLSGGPRPESTPKRMCYGTQDLHKLPQKPILDELAYCSECEFSTKVRVNLVRHIQQHAENQLVPNTAPVNPVPHLVTNEKHFDRMINLASSSLELARAEKPTPSVTLYIPPEAASRYPKYVPDRQRHTCGAKDCAYISVDETMLKCHWETLHAGSNDFHCVHCPPYQHLDTSKPLTSARIIAHLKMHDIRLYACSSCNYYHHRKQVLEKHLVDVHKGTGQVMIVREESSGPSPAGIPQTTITAPTMDLKPWKCGLCAFSSMLRPEVVEHCSKTHGSKMQFKCPVCPFRASTIENVKKHQTNSHSENTEDIFYYYYREGTVLDEPDGTPRWVKQRQKVGNPDPEPEPEVKTETPDSNPQQTPLTLRSLLLAPAHAPANINLDIIKKEVVETETEDSIEDLCKRFGEICDPNGLKYKCPLCKLVTEDRKDTMQSHLYEELQCRKWGCRICSYKAFHKTGFNEHMFTEHRQNRMIEPMELPVDARVERWVNKVLEHQSTVIETNKANLAQQKVQVERANPVLATKNVEKTAIAATDKNKKEEEDLIKAFGPFGAPNSINFSCPKCDFQHMDEGAMKDHLETELNKIRWRCSTCWDNSQNYHEAQLHSKTCKSSRPGQLSRPVEAIRDPSVRSAWLSAVIRSQKVAMNDTPESATECMTLSPLENSLLVVRYEERVPTPEEEMINRRKRPAPVTTTQTAAPSPDSDDERLIIDETDTDEADTPKKKSTMKKCPHCSLTTKYPHVLDSHILRHYNLKPLKCFYCDFTGYKSSAANHSFHYHPNLPEKFVKTKLPPGPPLVLELSQKGAKKRSVSSEEPPKSKDEIKKDDVPKVVCLICEKSVSESETASHTHDKPTHFAKKGEVIVKCCICLSLFPTINLMKDHNNLCHPNTQINYAFFKLHYDTREIHQCGHCSKRFKFLRDLKTHHNTFHSSLQLKYESKPYFPGAYDFECENEDKGESSNRKSNYGISQAPKRVARKSTTKLPCQAVARKSTTKLPYSAVSDPDDDFEDQEEYSYYGTKPTPLEHLENVTTLMPFCNTIMSFSVKKLSEIIKINPQVYVKDCKK